MSIGVTDGMVELGREEAEQVMGGVVGVDDIIIIGVCVGVVAIVAWWAYDRHQSSKTPPAPDPNPNFGHHSFTLGR